MTKMVRPNQIYIDGIKLLGLSLFIICFLSISRISADDKECRSGFWSANGPLEAPPLADGNFPFSFRWKGNRWLALGDLHGDFVNTLLLLNSAGLTDLEGNWIGGNALLIQTGDIIDRGPEGKQLYDFFNQLRLEARNSGGEILQLVGNHDAMNLCGDFRYAHPEETEEFGGMTKRKEAFRDDGYYGAMLKSFPIAVMVDDILLSHAGVSESYAKIGLEKTTSIYRAEVENGCHLHKKKQLLEYGMHSGDVSDNVKEISVLGNDGPLWTRVFAMGSIENICKNTEATLNVLGSRAMVIGHTVQENGSIGVFCGGQLFVIDTGISRYVANRPRILEKNGNYFYEWKFEFNGGAGVGTVNNIQPEKRLLFAMKSKNFTSEEL